MCRHLINFIILVGVILTTGTSINYDEEKNEELKNTKEPTKNEEIPGKLIVQTKSKILSGKCIDLSYFFVTFFLMLILNGVFYLLVVCNE